MKSVTSVNAKVFHLQQLGKIQAGLLADIVIVKGDPTKKIVDVRNVELVMKNGVISVKK